MDFSSLDLKKTVNLPSTAFPMKANLATVEPKMLEKWNHERIYEQISASRQGRPMYVLHDGPPYANGNIHLGHAFNKILKDFIIKSKVMAGYDSPYVPGWDCHGLPIEIKVDALLGAKKAAMSVAADPRRVPQIRSKVRRAAEPVIPTPGRLRPLGPALHHHERRNTKPLSPAPSWTFSSQGSVYKGLKPVNWCLHCRTALAEAEVEYENHTSPSIWVRFKLASDPARSIPLSLAAMYTASSGPPHRGPSRPTSASPFIPKFEYAAVEVDGAVYIVAVGLLEATAASCGWRNVREFARFEGAVLDRAVFRHPFLDRDSLGIIEDYVTLEQGTGAVHTAPGHGQEDYVAGMQYGLPIYCPIDAARPLLPRPRRLRHAARSAHRQDRLGGQSDRLRDPAASTARCWPKSTSTTAIRTAGAATIRPFSAPPSSGSSAWT